MPVYSICAARIYLQTRQQRSAGYEALSPDDTYFVVFSYGAVVLFQGVRTCFLPADAAATTTFKPLRLQPHSVKPPVDPPYPSGPWDTDLHEWREAAAAAETARDDEIIMLLLRPFMHHLKDNLAVRADDQSRESLA